MAADQLEWRVRDLERDVADIRTRIKDIDENGTREVRVLKRDIEHIREQVDAVHELARSTQRVVLGAAITITTVVLGAMITLIVALSP